MGLIVKVFWGQKFQHIVNPLWDLSICLHIMPQKAFSYIFYNHRITEWLTLEGSLKTIEL